MEVVDLNKYPIVQLDQILTANTEAIEKFKQQLSKQGWCLVNLPKDLVLKANQAVEAFKKFLSTDDYIKYQYHYPPRYGYIKTQFKEAFRLLTGQMIDQMEIPSEFQNKEESVLKDISINMDNIAKQIINNCQEQVFEVNFKEIQEWNLPLINERQCQFANQKGYGMLDIVQYCAQQQTNQAEDIVSAHGDPGLFALSLISTEEGLQMFDPDTQQ